MKKMAKTLFCTSVMLSVSSLALADVSVPAGWYLEGNFGEAKAMGKSYPGVSSVKNTGKGWGVNIGYKFKPFLGLEAGYTRYAPTRLNSPVETVARDSHTAIDVAAKGILPIGCSGIELFAKVGVARINSQVGIIDGNGAAAYNLTFNTSSQSSTGLFVGGGAQYSFTPNIAANVQWEKAKGNSKTGSLQLLSAGISYIVDPAVT
jgi:opacity protein-like surface antigen